MGIIKIRGLEISACHGVKDFEKVNPQRFVFDADLTCDFYAAAISDDLEKTVNYSRVCKEIAEVTRGNVFNLIEKLAYECAFSIMEKFERVEKITLTVNKPDAPVKQKFDTVAVTVTVEREKAYLSIGSNLGDKKQYLDTAIKMLNETRGVKVEKISDYISSEPYGGVAKNEFLNCAAVVSTLLTPHALLDEIHRIEAECGRARKERWGDRTLDIDIIFFGEKKIRDERLIIPHPDYKNRDFVKKPLKQIAPHMLIGIDD
ncbi:MAG: 2-amino-4-hydroxy-6-hydroxymethyldihydropteridine diphosphokinase [Clostridia bacterium]|nr:2-amino-4-hydroxy-6-hydroxymethyldihydropteridine diphosphokinase [Clostridia bacterium]